ncbi:hypothetical protein BUALT_Bualt12G0067500 [Buddleja alternifolia]|uniref:Uncharacterized protein n=1 Tax=Buddleja alternifolia TaxID=168488 RepID=A0AAV6WZV1_9LAMI|nr:hypothetical protein BUALT_Bualt12G0067500 [Buddleja alternifolia]
MGNQPPNDPSCTSSPIKLTYQQFDDKANEEAQVYMGLGQNVLPEVLPRHEVPSTINLISNGSDVVHSTTAGEPQALNPNVETILYKRKAVDAPFREGSSGSFHLVGEEDGHLKEKVAKIEELLVEDRKEAYVRKGKVPFVFEGEFWDPKWKVSNESSIFEMGAGGTSFELYKACMIPRDKARFIDAPHPNVEEYGAHFLMQNAKLACDEQISSLKEAKKKLDADLSDVKGALKDTLLHFDEMEARHYSELSEKDTLILMESKKVLI